MLFLKFASSSSSCPTKIELQGVSRTFETFSRARFASSESGLISRGPVSRTRPRSARVPVDNTLLHQLSGFLSPPSSLPLYDSSPPRRSSIPPRSTLSSTSTFSLSFSPVASLLPFDLRFLALPRLNSLLLSASSESPSPRPPTVPLFFVSLLEAGTGPAITRSRLTVAPCMAACFMPAALHCDARRGVRAATRRGPSVADRNTRGCIHLASLRAALLNDRPRAGPSCPRRPLPRV